MLPDLRTAPRPVECTVLVTGAGGPAAVAVIRSLQRRPGVRVLAADLSPLASGLYLVPDVARHLVPAGDDPAFADELLGCAIRSGADVVIPTVDAELEPLAARTAAFEAAGIRLVLGDGAALAACLDKLALARRCTGVVPVPRTELLRETDPRSWAFPAIVKPRRGSGSRGVRTVQSGAELAQLKAAPAEEELIVQAHLPGAEYSVDVLATAAARVVAAVPRARLRIDSGVAVAGRTLRDEELQRLAAAVVTELGLGYVCNVQFRRDAAGRPHLLEVNPRFPGSMPLTIASGVDMPRLCLDVSLGRPVPEHVAHRELVNVRFLEDRFVSPGEFDTFASAGAPALAATPA